MSSICLWGNPSLPHLPPTHCSTPLPKHSDLQVRVAFWKNLGKDSGHRWLVTGLDRNPQNLNLAIHYCPDFPGAQSPSVHYTDTGNQAQTLTAAGGLAGGPPSEKPRTGFRLAEETWAQQNSPDE